MDATLLFSDNQIAALALQAKAALPSAVNGRIEKAVRLVQSASVELHEDGSATVLSESDGLTGYRVHHGQCSCPDFQFQPTEVGGWCCHRIARSLVIRLQQQHAAPLDVTPQAVPPGPDVPQPDASASGTIPDLLRPHVVMIQGKAFVKFAGLLTMAHAHGLTELQETWTFNDETLSLAHATAVFQDGRRFAGSGDATPTNVTKKVAQHFRRVALTRAKSRALRDALNIDMVAVEELGEDA